MRPRRLSRHLGRIVRLYHNPAEVAPVLRRGVVDRPVRAALVGLPRAPRPVFAALHRVTGRRRALVGVVAHAVLHWGLGEAEHARQLLSRADPPLGSVARALQAELVRAAIRDGGIRHANELLAQHMAGDALARWLRRELEDRTAWDVELLFESEPLLTYRELRDAGWLPLLPRRLLRRIHRRLRQYGYLGEALAVLRLIAAASGALRDAALLAVREQELAFQSGRWAPAVHESVPVRQVPGTVLHVVGKALPLTQTGYTLRTHYVLKAQRAAGYDARVFCQGNEGSVVHEPTWVDVDGVPYHVHAGPLRSEVSVQEWMEANIAALRLAVRQVGPVALHAHSDYVNAQLATAVGRETGVPVIYESRGFWEESWLARTLDRFALSSSSYFTTRLGMPDAYTMRADRERDARHSANVVVTLARTMRDHIVDRGLDPQGVYIVPNGVDVDAFASAERQPAMLTALGIGQSATVVGYISSLVAYEGIDTLIDGFCAMDAAGPVHLVIVGDGPERERLERRAATSSARSRIHFTGRVEHDLIPAYYGLIDIFVVPRKAADVCQLVTPLKPFEALAAGCCVVVSDVAALREIVEDSNGAIRSFTAESAGSLADVLTGLERDPVARRATGRAGREWVARDRSWAAVVARYEPAYARVGLGRGSA